MGKQIDNYSLQAELGSGVYSRVFKAIHIVTKQEVAIKMVKADKFREMPKLEEGTINEINTLTSLRPCPNIIRYYDMLKTVNNFYFVYEYCNGGTLQKVLKTHRLLGEKQSLLYFKQLTNAFKVLAQNNIMHRDIKPENILIHNNVLKVADFGFCKPLEHQDGMAETMLGSPIYMAPEVLKGETYTIKADVWSLGVVLYRMVFGFCPFQSNNIGKLIMILNENQMRIPDQPKISSTLEQLLRKMLTKDPKKRADWNQVFNYQITENGEMFDVRLKYDSPKASTMASMNLNKSSFIKDEQDDQIKNIRKVQSPQHYDSRHEKHLNRLNTLMPEPSMRQTFKSPLRETTYNSHSKKETNIKNHKKCVQLFSIVMEIIGYECPDGMCISYFICKNIEKEFLMVRENIKKQSLAVPLNIGYNRGQENFFAELSSVLSEQLKNLNQIMFSLEKNLIEIGYKPAQVLENRKRHLKSFIMFIKNEESAESKQELSLCNQLLDFIMEQILINKKTYERLSCEQMDKKIKDRLYQIN